MAGQVAWFEDLFFPLSCFYANLKIANSVLGLMFLCMYIAASCVEEVITNAGIDVWRGALSDHIPGFPMPTKCV